MADDCLRLIPWFASPDALVPRVLQIGGTTTSARSEPRSTATATTQFAGFPNVDAFGAHGTNSRRDCRCLYVDIGQRHTHTHTHTQNAIAVDF